MQNVIEIIFQIALAVVLLYVAITVGKALTLASYHPETMGKKLDSKE